MVAEPTAFVYACFVKRGAVHEEAEVAIRSPVQAVAAVVVERSILHLDEALVAAAVHIVYHPFADSAVEDFLGWDEVLQAPSRMLVVGPLSRQMWVR